MEEGVATGGAGKPNGVVVVAGRKKSEKAMKHKGNGRLTSENAVDFLSPMVIIRTVLRLALCLYLYKLSKSPLFLRMLIYVFIAYHGIVLPVIVIHILKRAWDAGHDAYYRYRYYR